MIGAALVAALALASQLQTHPTGLPSVGPSRANSLRTAPIMDKLYEQAGKPALDFDFARYKDLHDNASGATSLINFSRSAAQSPGTYVGADGLIHDAAVNLALYSEQFDSWTNYNSTDEVNQSIAPDGKQTADIVRETASSTGHSVYRTHTFDGLPKTYSAYIKKSSGTHNVGLGFYAGATSVKFAFNPETGAGVGSFGTEAFQYGSESVGNGWFRVWVSGIVASGSGGYAIYSVNGTTESFAGDTANSFLVWGAQLEETDAATMQPTAYIKTTSQALAAPRFDHTPTTGNLTTNLLTYSEMLDQSSAWSKFGIDPQPVQASVSTPYGNTASLFTPNTASTNHLVRQGPKTISPSTNYTASAFFKTNGNDYGSITVWDGTSFVSAIVDLTDGSVTNSGSSGGVTFVNAISSDEQNGWYRLALTFSQSASSAYVYLGSYVANTFNAGLPSQYAGNGVDGTYFFGAQLEAAPAPGPYVRTLSETRSISDANAESLGLLVEEARANVFTNSEIFNSGYSKQGVTVTDNFSTAPTGQQTASGFFASGTSGAGGVYRSATTTTNQAMSFFVKSGTKNWAQLITGNGSQAAWFDLSTGTIGTVNAIFTSTNIEDYGNGWFRISAARPHAASSLIGIRFVDANNSAGYSGATVGDLLGQAFGAQLEEATFPTSYIPTVTSQYRYADVAAVQDEDFSTTNLLAYSESFDVGWAATGVTITENAVISPDGTQTADEFSADTTSYRRIDQPATTVSGVKYTLSVYAKAGNQNFVALEFRGTGSSPDGVFDLSTGTVSSGAGSIESVGNGWYRCSITEAATSTTSYAIISRGLSGSIGDTVYLWGASLTATEYPVEYTTTRNLLTDSQDFERSGWTKDLLTVENDYANAPDGTPTADRLKENATNTVHRIYQLESGSFTGQYVASAYVKASGRDEILIRAISNSVSSYSVFDLSDETVTNYGPISPSQTSITATGDDWYRIQRTDNLSSASTRIAYFGLHNGSAAYLGDGTSGVLVWGAQLEPGTTGTDYVRTVDVVGKNYGWYEPTEGTVFVDVVPAYDGAQTASVVSFNTTTYQESNIIYKANSTAGGDGLRWVAQTFDVAIQATLPTPTDIADVEASLAFGYKHNDFGFGVEGSLIGPDPTGTTPNPSQMYIMNRDGSLHLNGHIKRLTYWPRRQADSTLQVITQ